MDPLMQLAVMWFAGQQGGASSPPTPPTWPTTASPPPLPPPLPAFSATPTTPTPADASQPSTPLAELHTTPPTPKPASSTPKASTPKAATTRPQAPNVVPGMLRSTLPVASLQKALLARGVKVTPDGLYGPQTAAAWSKTALSKGLPPYIARKGPKLAEVVTHTWDALSFPAIP